MSKVICTVLGEQNKIHCSSKELYLISVLRSFRSSSSNSNNNNKQYGCFPTEQDVSSIPLPPTEGPAPRPAASPARKGFPCTSSPVQPGGSHLWPPVDISAIGGRRLFQCFYFEFCSVKDASPIIVKSYRKQNLHLTLAISEQIWRLSGFLLRFRDKIMVSSGLDPCDFLTRTVRLFEPTLHYYHCDCHLLFSPKLAPVGSLCLRWILQSLMARAKSS